MAIARLGAAHSGVGSHYSVTRFDATPAFGGGYRSWTKTRISHRLNGCALRERVMLRIG